MTNFLNISIIFYLIFWAILYFIIYLINKFKNKNQLKYSIDQLKENRELGRIFLDRYYVTNLSYTIICVFFYLLGNVGIFLFIRYLYLQNVVIILPQKGDLCFYMLFIILKYFFVIMITLLLYRALLASLFKNEINKLHFYLESIESLHLKFKNRLIKEIDYYNFQKMLAGTKGGYTINSITKYFLGFFRVLFYRAYTFTFIHVKEGELLSNKLPDDYSCIFYEEFLCTGKSKKYIKVIYKLMVLCKKYKKIKKIIEILSKIFRWLFIHLPNINRILPGYILVITFFYDLYNLTFTNVYLASFIFLLFKTKNELIKFYDNRNALLDSEISRYYYSNNKDYAKQRLNFHVGDNLVVTSSSNYYFWNQEKYLEILEYIFRDFKNKYPGGLDEKKKGMYIRGFVIVTNIFLGYNLYKINIETNIPFIMFLILIPIMIYINSKIYYANEYHENYEHITDWTYNKNKERLFWILVILQGYINWVLIFKSQITILDTEVLIDILGIKIEKIYTIEEKIRYLYQYLEYKFSTVNEIKDLKSVIRRLYLEKLITKEVSLESIRIQVDTIIANHVENRTNKE